MSHAPAMAFRSPKTPQRLGDYSADYRMLILAEMATVAGTGGALSAWALLKLIAFATNLLWYGNFSFVRAVIADRGPLMVLFVPVIGGLIVGLMAKFGSDKIRGHGIPEYARRDGEAAGPFGQNPADQETKKLRSGFFERFGDDCLELIPLGKACSDPAILDPSQCACDDRAFR